MGAIILSFSIIMSSATRIYAGNVQSVEAEAGSSELVTEKEMFRYTSPYGKSLIIILEMMEILIQL